MEANPDAVSFLAAVTAARKQGASGWRSYEQGDSEESQKRHVS